MAHPSRPRGAVFRPRFTLTIVYFAGFFLLYCAALAAPPLLHAWRDAATSSEQQDAAAFAAVRAAVGARLSLAVVGAIATLALGLFARVLPGLRGPR